MSETDLAEVWARSLAGLADIQLEAHQRAWLNLTRPLGLVENTALIATPNEFAKEQLETRLRTLVTHALSRELGRNIQLAVTVDPAAADAGLALPAQAGGLADGAGQDEDPREGRPGDHPGSVGPPHGSPHRGADARQVTGLPAPPDESRHLGAP
ncbi:MAG TPA: chromosomal replication initiator protein DnaA, partial [Streptosporangiaceae bacterium]|nr:chromosomal replication initiator protein DnaA [Streptosporangiaceae bacterium]